MGIENTGARKPGRTAIEADSGTKLDLRIGQHTADAVHTVIILRARRTGVAVRRRVLHGLPVWIHDHNIWDHVPRAIIRRTIRRYIRRFHRVDVARHNLRSFRVYGWGIGIRRAAAADATNQERTQSPP